MKIRKDDLSNPKVAKFLDEHLKDMRAASPPESTHALDLDGLKQSEISFWTVWEDDCLIGCGALKDLGQGHGELKSMRVASKHKQKGIASELLAYIIAEAKNVGFVRLSLETGSQPFFEPARKFYTKFGFVVCKPFSNYKEDANSVFMTRVISDL